MSLLSMFQYCAGRLKTEFTNRGITVSGSEGFTSTLLFFFDLIDAKVSKTDISQSIDTSTTKVPSNNAVKTSLDGKIGSSQVTIINFTKDDGTTGHFKVVDYVEDS